MNKIVMLMLVFMLMFVAAPAYSAVEVVQIFNCQMDDAATDEELKAVATEWLKAANKMKGGEQLEVHLRRPLVAQMGESDFSFMVKVPSLVEWGMFTSGYEGSALEEIDDRMDKLADCPDSALWEIIKLK